MTVTLHPARSAADLDAVRRLFSAYAASLDIDLAYQGFSAELDGLPGRYAPPGGEILLARQDDEVIGCVALRPLGDGVCEMKRLYVAPEVRGLSLGRRMAEAIIAVATGQGYREIRLDTLATMAGAIALYEKLGFVRIPAYYDTPIAGTVFFARDLLREQV